MSTLNWQVGICFNILAALLAMITTACRPLMLVVSCWEKLPSLAWDFWQWCQHGFHASYQCGCGCCNAVIITKGTADRRTTGFLAAPLMGRAGTLACHHWQARGEDVCPTLQTCMNLLAVVWNDLHLQRCQELMKNHTWQTAAVTCFSRRHNADC